MNRQSKISLSVISLLFSVFLISSHSSAQPGQQQRPPMLPDSSRIVQMVDELAKVLSLSKEQKKNVTDLHFAHFEAMKKLMEKNQGKREDIRNAHDELREQFEKQIKALLNDKQQAEFEEFLNRQHEREGNRKHRPRR